MARNYRLQSMGDMAFGSACLSVHPLVIPFMLEAMKHKTKKIYHYLFLYGNLFHFMKIEKYAL